ncbi:MAG: hypothetical protein IT460_02570 [Planctomycetes bacterium]|nr:hypothetical protein [Planctomycetota bacterium]
MGWLADVYLVCAIVGGTLLVLQTVLTAIGGGHGDADLHGGADVPHDVPHGVGPDLGAHGHAGTDGHEGVFVKWLSFRTAVACLTFFGLAGLAAQHAGVSDVAGVGIALVAGTVAIVAVALLMATLARLQSGGNVDLRNAVGRVGKVYLRVPGKGTGHGKVSVEVQGRFAEVAAVSSGPDIPTGADVRVVALVSPETVEVAPLGEPR